METYFESVNFTLSENSEQVEVCLNTSNAISYSFTLCLDIMSNSTQATGKPLSEFANSITVILCSSRRLYHLPTFCGAETWGEKCVR